jgi:hypothetical protein
MQLKTRAPGQSDRKSLWKNSPKGSTTLFVKMNV